MRSAAGPAVKLGQLRPSKKAAVVAGNFSLELPERGKQEISLWNTTASYDSS